MNRLESGEPREVIVYKIIRDGIYRHLEADQLLSDYIHSDKDEAIVGYYDIMDSNEDALEDAYSEALLCSDIYMKDVCRLLDEYLRIAVEILDDAHVCKITDEALAELMDQAWHILEQADEYGRKCLDSLGFQVEDEHEYLMKRLTRSEFKMDDEK